MTEPLDEFTFSQILVMLNKQGLLDHRINAETGADEWKITETGKQWIKEQTEPQSLYD